VKGVVLLVAGELALLWVIASAASRGQGLWFFAAGLAALAAALLAYRRGRRPVLYGLWFASLLAALTALGLEAALHLWPGILEGRVANVAYTGYHWQRGGIYRLDPHAGPVMRPGVRRRMYWNGHWWTHDSNAEAYRGPLLGRAPAVFLGDSMVYGHGVEADQAVPAAFARHTGVVAANLGQQGTCVLQALLRFLDTGAALRPSVVFVCVHHTDVEEAERYYGDAELQRFLGLSVVDGARPNVVPEYRPRAWWNPARLWAEDLAIPLRCAGILGAVGRSLGESDRARGGARRDPFIPTDADVEAPMPALDPAQPAAVRLPWEANRHALAELQRACTRIGARLVVFDLGYPRVLTESVERAAGEAGAAYSPAGRVALARARAGEVVYLAGDGHWSPRGAEIVAEELARVPGWRP
jgi:hypothetical protein